MAVDAGDAAAKSHETPGAGSPDAARTRRTPLGPSAGARLCNTRTLGLRNWGWIHLLQAAQRGVTGHDSLRSRT